MHLHATRFGLLAFGLASGLVVACGSGRASGLADGGADPSCGGETFAPCTPAPGDGGKHSDAQDSDAREPSDASDASDAKLVVCNDAPSPVAITATCTQGALASYDAPKVCAPELHVIGVYEASSNHTTAFPATAGVDFPGRGPIVLVLAAYEAVDWTVTATPGTIIDRVILAGYKSQTAIVPAGVHVDDYSGAAGALRKADYEYPGSGGLLSAVEAKTGLPTTSFHGCYQGTAFTLK